MGSGVSTVLTEPVNPIVSCTPVICTPQNVKPTSESFCETIEQKPVRSDVPPTPPTSRAKPFTAPWVVRRIKEDKLTDALVQLRLWMPDRRRVEATEELVQLVASLDDDEALQAVYELRSRRRYVRGSKGRELKVPALLQTLDSLAQFQVTGLIDSGCTGSCVDRKFVERNGISTTKLRVPIPIYNADGSVNAAGSITDFVELRMTLKDHTERITLAVTDLGKTDLFIGHDWLKIHNPSIDWQSGTVTFDRCPDACGYNLDFLDIDTDPDPDMEPDPMLDDRDRKSVV